MDFHRPELSLQKRRRRYIVAAICALVAALLLLGLRRLSPAAPVVERSSLWTDTVRRGAMVRSVRGNGTLVPEQAQWLAAATDGRVEKIIVWPGTAVARDTVILKLSNAEIEQAARDAGLQLKAGIADLAQRRAELRSTILNERAECAKVKADFAEARLKAQVDADLAGNGLTSQLTAKLSRGRADELETRNAIEGERLQAISGAADAQISAVEARVDQLRELAELRASQARSLEVRAPIDGVVQQLAVEAGQRVAAGTTLARVARPEPLMAQLRIPETSVRDVAVGQPVSVDTRNGIVAGRVARIDPAAREGSVTIDVSLRSPLPRGARPDSSVDGTIQLEDIPDTLFVGRPAQAGDSATIALYRLSADEETAQRTNVTLGRTSSNAVEIRSGLNAGDKVILSDMSAWDRSPRIRIH